MVASTGGKAAEWTRVRVYAQCSKPCNLGIDPVKQWGRERRGHVRDAL